MRSTASLAYERAAEGTANACFEAVQLFAQRRWLTAGWGGGHEEKGALADAVDGGPPTGTYVAAAAAPARSGVDFNQLGFTTLRFRVAEQGRRTASGSAATGIVAGLTRAACLRYFAA